MDTFTTDCFDTSSEYGTFITAVYQSDSALVEDQRRVPERDMIGFIPAASPSSEGRVVGDPLLDEPLLEFLQKDRNASALT